MKMLPEILRLQLDEHDAVAKTIYETLYGGNDYGISRTWEGSLYAAPETTGGYAARLIQATSNNLRRTFLITPLGD